VKGLAETHTEIIPFFGVHPWYLDQIGPDWPLELATLLDSMPSGVGEIGLDHAVVPRDDARQEDVFLMQLNLARERALPLNLHCRKAFDRLSFFLEAYPLTAPAIVHSYSGPAELIPRLTAAGVYFSFSGSVTRSGNKRVHRALAAVPLERLLIETDSPDIPPVINHTLDYNQPNEPANLTHVLQVVADSKGVTVERMAEITWENTKTVVQALHLG
jgi:TatD DNase family protein